MKLDFYKNYSDSKWFEYIRLIKTNKNIDNDTLNNIVKEFQQQILEDEQLMNNEDIISDCCVFAPRKRSVLQRKYNLSKRISNSIFKEITNEVHAVIHYHRLIAKLTRYYIEQEDLYNELDIPNEDN